MLLAFTQAVIIVGYGYPALRGGEMQDVAAGGILLAVFMLFVLASGPVHEAEYRRHSTAAIARLDLAGETTLGRRDLEAKMLFHARAQTWVAAVGVILALIALVAQFLA